LADRTPNPYTSPLEAAEAADASEAGAEPLMSLSVRVFDAAEELTDVESMLRPEDRSTHAMAVDTGAVGGTRGAPSAPGGSCSSAYKTLDAEHVPLRG
jgi:hypothetical protein